MCACVSMGLRACVYTLEVLVWLPKPDTSCVAAKSKHIPLRALSTPSYMHKEDPPPTLPNDPTPTLPNARVGIIPRRWTRAIGVDVMVSRASKSVSVCANTREWRVESLGVCVYESMSLCLCL